MVGILVLAHHELSVRAPDQSAASDSGAGTARCAQLCQAARQFTQRVDRLIGEIIVVLLERPRGERQSVGHAPEQSSLRPAQQCNGLWRKRSWVKTSATPAPMRASLSRSTPASESATDDRKDRSDGRLGDHDPGAAQSARECRRDEDCEGHRRVAAADSCEDELAHDDPENHALGAVAEHSSRALRARC